MKSLIRHLCFASIGIASFYSPLTGLSLGNIVVGGLLGLIFGWLFKGFLNILLGLFNGPVKKEQGKKAIKEAVKTGFLFLVPFVVMLLLAVFYLQWSQTLAFVSAGIMAVGTASAIEMGKLTGKSSMKNTVISSGVCFIFSGLWTFSTPHLQMLPSQAQAIYTLLAGVIKGGGLG